MPVFSPITAENLKELSDQEDASFEHQTAPIGYILVDDYNNVSEISPSDQVDLSSISAGYSKAQPSLAKNKKLDKLEKPGYIVNTEEVDEGNLEKLEEGSEMLGGETEAEVSETVDQILEDAGLSEKPEEMTPEEYAEAKAQAILAWVEENIADKKDEGADNWQDAGETLEKGTGDCEDKAILIAEMLEAAGCDSSDVAVVVSADGSHAYVAVEIGGKVYVLDNGEFTETGYSSLEEFLSDENLVGAWFSKDSQGINNENLEINTAEWMKQKRLMLQAVVILCIQRKTQLPT